ncbi:uncharacterized protein LOC120134181 [Hibiscus syriacus]|uniref:uncharacterized protein LOC120134181 n=1 Tax=Hibiscus syriacus TaxID=106335 RepID=UPI001923A5A8|nr:uncharacterized protein LOC120134181 [Hibiscus syriacus]
MYYCKRDVLGNSVFISAIYGSNDGINRRQLWLKLKEVNSIVNQSSCVLGGDFNIFLHSHESSDHDLIGHYNSPDMKEFQEFTQEFALLDHPFFGPKFTWSNKQHELFLGRKLDRVIINPSWAPIFQQSFVEFLAPGISDHIIAIIWLSKDIPASRPKPFNFLNFWAAHPNFLNVVRNSWHQEVQGNPMMVLFTKLRRLKDCLIRFKQENYSNLLDRVKLKRMELENQQLLTLKGEEAIEKELAIHKQLKTLEEVESLFFKQKTKVQWIRDGDKNTNFFHSIVAFKKKKRYHQSP